MTTPYISQTQYGKNEAFELQVSRGQVQGHSAVTFSGYNTDIDTTWESLIPSGGVIVYPTSAEQMKVSSSSANDTAAGTGARTITITGLDASWNEISEVVTMNGQTAVLTTNSFLRINGLSVTTADGLLANAGNIYVGNGVVTAGVPATIYDMIPAGFNNRQTHAYTIPANYTGYIVSARFVTAQTAGSDAVWARLTMTNSDGIKRSTSVAQMNNGILILPVGVPIRVTEKTTIAGEGMGNAANNSCSSVVQLILVKNSTGY